MPYNIFSILILNSFLEVECHFHVISGQPEREMKFLFVRMVRKR